MLFLKNRETTKKKSEFKDTKLGNPTSPGAELAKRPLVFLFPAGKGKAMLELRPDPFHF